MERSLEARLRAHGLVFRDDEGREAIRVTLQYRDRLLDASREARRDQLHRVFAEADAASPVTVFPETLSVSGQVVEARAPLTDYDAISEQLDGRSIRVDPVIPHGMEL